MSAPLAHIVLLGVLVTLAPGLGHAQVTLDGTIGTAGAGPVAPGIDDLGQPATSRASPAACAPTSTARCARRCRAPRST
jgi:hypothetical protein